MPTSSGAREQCAAGLVRGRSQSARAETTDAKHPAIVHDDHHDESRWKSDRPEYRDGVLRERSSIVLGAFGSVLQDHYNVWSASGLLGTFKLLKNLSWPTTFPTYTLHSTVMGTFTFDFNAWSGMINALRALVIAGAGFVAYRIIFVGGQ